MKHLTVASQQEDAGTTASAIRRVSVVDCFANCPGAGRRGIARMGCFT
ncbi:MAG TPA: hypothetical protein VE129_17940 [Thermoanaerobaculia bacterium]|nr:hypothetical protein [Thermoanaerobaculia bacterium]